MFLQKAKHPRSANKNTEIQSFINVVLRNNFKSNCIYYYCNAKNVTNYIVIGLSALAYVMYVNYFKLVYYVIPALQFLHEIQNPIPTISFKKNIIFYNLLKLFHSYVKAQNQWNNSTYFVTILCSCCLYRERKILCSHYVYPA